MNDQTLDRDELSNYGIRLVLSMTSIPQRVNQLPAVLRACLRQSRLPDAIYLNIPRKTRSHVPYVLGQALLSFCEAHRNLVYLNQECQDFGPLTKLLPTLELEPPSASNAVRTYIATIDDDHIFADNDALALLERKIRQYPYAVLGFGGWRFGFFPFYLQRVVRQDKDLSVDWLMGVMLQCFRRSWLDAEALLRFEPGFRPEDLYHNDDKRIAIYLARRGIPRIAIGYPKKRKPFRQLANSHIHALSGGVQLNLRSLSRFWQHFLEHVRMFRTFHKQELFPPAKRMALRRAKHGSGIARNSRVCTETLACSYVFYVFLAILFVVLLIVLLVLRASSKRQRGQKHSSKRP